MVGKIVTDYAALISRVYELVLRQARCSEPKAVQYKRAALDREAVGSSRGLEVLFKYLVR